MGKPHRARHRAHQFQFLRRVNALSTERKVLILTDCIRGLIQETMIILSWLIGFI